MNLSTTDRGIIISTPYEFDGSMYKSNGQNLDPNALRQYLLYWDRMNWPINHTRTPFNFNLFGNETAETQFLTQENILVRSQFAFKHNALFDVAKMVPTTQMYCLEQCNEHEPGQWSLAQQSAYLVDTKNMDGETRSVEVGLYDCIPVPAPEVPLENILDFKIRRRDELLAFRATMDDFYQEIINAGDIPRAKLQAQASIERSINDLRNAMMESFTSRLLGALKVELNGMAIAAGAAAGATTFSQMSLPPGVGAAAGAVVSTIKFDLAPTRRGMKVPEKLKDYAYIHSIGTKLI